MIVPYAASAHAQMIFNVPGRMQKTNASVEGSVVNNIARLRTFVADFTRLADASDGNETAFFGAGKSLLQELIRRDDWLPPAFARADPARYQQYLLHCDPLERFSVVSFVWDRGQSTPIHNHTVWGMVGVLRGAEIGTRYVRTDADLPLAESGARRFEAEQIDLVSPAVGDIHRVQNAIHGVSVSIHVYGANIGAVRRAVFGPAGDPRSFVSGYSSEFAPNLWDRSS
jgi:predicted metal-dependent enzyme (double-stranded beta helix superfamily)